MVGPVNKTVPFLLGVLGATDACANARLNPMRESGQKATAEGHLYPDYPCICFYATFYYKFTAEMRQRSRP